MAESVSNDRGHEKTAVLANALLTNGILYEKIEFDDELNTCLVFLSTRRVSAVDIPPLERAAREANAELSAVIDSSQDQLCFFVIFR